MRKTMGPSREIQRKATVTLTNSELRLLQDEARRRDTSLATLIREQLSPLMDKIKRQAGAV